MGVSPLPQPPLRPAATWSFCSFFACISISLELFLSFCFSASKAIFWCSVASV